MEFLNIGGLELVLILVVAFIVLGPKRITKFGNDFGVWVRKLNRNETFRDVIQTTDEIRNYPRKILQDAMLEDPVLPRTILSDSFSADEQNDLHAEESETKQDSDS